MSSAGLPRVALVLAATALAVRAAPPEAPDPPAAAETPAPKPAPSEEPWVVVTSRPILIRTRSHPGTAVKEIWASGVVAAPAEDVQAALLDGEAYPRFMPYVKEVRKLPVATTDGSWFTYQRVAPPFTAQRDTVLHIWVEQSLGEGGTGLFRNRWEAVAGMVPGAPGTVRTPVADGSWEVRPLPGGRSRAVYRFVLDPGGSIPSWVADMGNRSGVASIYGAVEGEAKRRSAERQRAGSGGGRPDAGGR